MSDQAQNVDGDVVEQDQRSYLQGLVDRFRKQRDQQAEDQFAREIAPGLLNELRALLARERFDHTVFDLFQIKLFTEVDNYRHASATFVVGASQFILAPGHYAGGVTWKLTAPSVGGRPGVVSESAPGQPLLDMVLAAIDQWRVDRDEQEAWDASGGFSVSAYEEEVS